MIAPMQLPKHIVNVATTTPKPKPSFAVSKNPVGKPNSAVGTLTTVVMDMAAIRIIATTSAL